MHKRGSVEPLLGVQDATAALISVCVSLRRCAVAYDRGAKPLSADVATRGTPVYQGEPLL